MVQSVGSVILSDGGAMVHGHDNRLMVRPKSRFLTAVEQGDAYSWACVTKNWAAGDTFIGLENNETARDLYIYRVIVSTLTTSRIVIFGTSSVTVAGTNAITGVNLNRDCGNHATATCYDDETGNAEAASSWPYRFSETYLLAGQTQDIIFNGSVVLPYDHYIGVDAVADTAGGTATIWGWFE